MSAAPSGRGLDERWVSPLTNCCSVSTSLHFFFSACFPGWSLVPPETDRPPAPPSSPPGARVCAGELRNFNAQAEFYTLGKVQTKPYTV